MSKKWLISWMAATVLSVGAPAALAVDSGFYAGGSFGYSDSDLDEDTIGPGFSGNVDDTDSGWRVLAGFQLTPNFALEGAYVDLGDYSAVGSVNGLAARTSLEIDGWQISGIGRFPVTDRVAIFGKAGAFIWDADAAGSLGPLVGAVSDDGTDVVFGAGVDFTVGQNVSLRAEWERFQSDPVETDVDFDFWSASLLFHFPQ